MPLDAGSVFARLGAVFDGSGFDKYDRAVDKAKRAKADAKLGAKVDERGFRQFASLNADAERRVNRLNVAFGNTINETQAFRNVIGLIKFPAFIAGAGMAAQALSALTAGAGAAATALAPLSGTLAAYPALGSAAAQGIGVTKLAFDGIAEAVGGLNEKMDRSSDQFKNLTPEAQAFAKTLDLMKDPVIDLQRHAQQGMFPGLREGLLRARPLLNAMHGVTERTGRAIGDLGSRLGALVGGRDFQRDLVRQGERNIRSINRFGSAGLHLANALRHVTIAAGPLVGWLGRSANAFGRNAERAAELGRQSGDLQRFFRETRSALSNVTGIAGGFGKALFNIGVIGYDAIGKRLLGDLRSGAREFQRWTRSAEGRNSIRQFFLDARPAIYEAGRLVRDLVQAFFRLGRGEHVAPLLRMLRVELLPRIEQLVATTTAGFGPDLIRMIEAFSRALISISGHNGPLTLMVRMITNMANAFADLMESSPVVRNLFFTMAGIAGIAKALNFAAAITGARTLLGLLRGARTAAAGTAAATAASGAAGSAVGGAAAGAAAGAAGGAASRGARLGAAARFLGPYAAVAGGVVGFQQAYGQRSDRFGLAQSGGFIGGWSRAAVRPVQELARGRIGAGIGAALFGTGDPERDLRRFGDTAEKALGKFRKARNAAGLSKLADDARELSRRFPGSSAALNKFAATAEDSARRFRVLRSTFGRTRIKAEDIMDPHAAEIFSNHLRHMRRNGVTSVTDLRNTMRSNMVLIRKSFVEGSEASQVAVARNFGAGITAVKDSMSRKGKVTQEGMREINRIVRRQMRFVRNNMGDLSGEARYQLARNFESARKAVERQAGGAAKATGNALKTIRRLMRDELRVYKITGRQATNYIRSRTDPSRHNMSIWGGHEEGMNRQRGGWIGRPGSAEPDGRIVRVGGGEAVVTRHQQRYINTALRAVFGTNLRGLFSKVKTPHWAPGFQRGGFPGVSGDTDFQPAVGRALSAMARGTGTSIFVQSGGRSIAEQAALYARYKSGRGALAAPPSPDAPHVKGVAADITPGRERFGSVAGRYGLAFTVPSESWHVEISGGSGARAGGTLGSADVSLPDVGVAGGGLFGVLADGAVSRINTLAEDRFNQLINDMGGGSGTGAGGGDQANMSLGRRLMERFWPGSQWPPLKELWTRESGWDNMARNPSSGAFGIPQALPPTKMPPAAQRGDAESQIMWGLRYIKGRYGSPAQALAFHNTHNWYEQGGFVEGFQSGGGDTTDEEARSPYRIRSLRRTQSDRVEDFEKLMGQVGDLQRHYELRDRAYGMDEEELIDQRTGAINVGAVRERAAELQDLLKIRRQIQARLRNAQRIAARIVRTYNTIIARLRRSLRSATRKERRGIRSQIRTYQGRLGEWRDKGKELGFDVRSAALDVRDIAQERASVLGTRAEVRDDTGSTDAGSTDAGDSGGDSGDSGSAEPTPAQIAAAAAEQLAGFQRARAELFSQFGSNFSRGNPFGDTSMQAAGLRFFGAFGGAGASPVEAAGGQRLVSPTIINNWNQPPPDPHTWSRGIEFELRA